MEGPSFSRELQESGRPLTACYARITDCGSKLSVLSRIRKEASVDTQLVRALLNPVRIRILDAVAESPASPQQLATALAESLGVVSYHVGVMRTTGCLQPVGAARPRRGEECVYELTPLAAPARQWISQRRIAPPTFGHPSAEAMRARVDREIAGLGVPGERQGDRLGCMSIALDQQGLRRVSAAIASALDQVSIAQEESARRLAGTDEKAIEATIALASFKSPSSSEANV
jgi:DNA-binding transcriptional ArsR family regulator